MFGNIEPDDVFMVGQSRRVDIACPIESRLEPEGVIDISDDIRVAEDVVLVFNELRQILGAEYD